MTLCTTSVEPVLACYGSCCVRELALGRLLGRAQGLPSWSSPTAQGLYTPGVQRFFPVTCSQLAWVAQGLSEWLALLSASENAQARCLSGDCLQPSMQHCHSTDHSTDLNMNLRNVCRVDADRQGLAWHRAAGCRR